MRILSLFNSSALIPSCETGFLIHSTDDASPGAEEKGSFFLFDPQIVKLVSITTFVAVPVTIQAKQLLRATQSVTEIIVGLLCDHKSVYRLREYEVGFSGAQD